jgi:hypothetical protein
VGHDTGRDDAHSRLDHPWEHGRFAGGFGGRHNWRRGRDGPGRFWCSGFYFSVAPDAVGLGDGRLSDAYDMVIYDDPITSAGTSSTTPSFAPTSTRCIWGRGAMTRL